MRLTLYFPEDSPTTHEFVGPKLSIGRLGDNDVQIDDGSVSSHHAEIELVDSGAVLRDLGSTNGTFINGEQLVGEVGIAEGSEIYIGNVRTVFMEPVESQAVEIEPAPSETEIAVVESGEAGRPQNFTYMSPIPKAGPTKDLLAIGAWAAAGLGLLAALYAVLMLASA
jgi:pSer/pThr/pTyr-binding forkhead associated (FHA) protein